MKSFLKDVDKNKMFLLMLIPGIIWFIMFCYIPMFGIIIAFKDFNYADGIFFSPWCGLKNFEFLFKAKDIYLILRNTICYNLVWIPTSIMLAVCFAIMYDALAKKRVHPWTKICQTVSLMPYFLSWMVISYFVTGLLDYDRGIANKVLEFFGLQPVNWYMESKYWPFILTVANYWKGIGYSSIIYYSTIRGFSPEYYEASWLDGANWYQQTRYITLPLMKPIITMMGIMSVGGILNSDFGLFYFIPKNSGLLYSTTSTLDTYIYNGMKSGGDFGSTGAINFVKSVVGFLMIISTNAVVRKYSYENSLF